MVLYNISQYLILTRKYCSKSTRLRDTHILYGVRTSNTAHGRTPQTMHCTYCTPYSTGTVRYGVHTVGQTHRTIDTGIYRKYYSIPVRYAVRFTVVLCTRTVRTHCTVRLRLVPPRVLSTSTRTWPLLTTGTRVPCSVLSTQYTEHTGTYSVQ